MQYEFDFASVLANWPQFLEGAWMTILLSFPATVIGFVGGTLLAIGRRGDTRWLVRACGAYVEVLRHTPRQVYWHVVLRPAMEKVYTALTSQFVLLMLASSITSQISVEELTAVAARVQSETFRPFEAYILVAVAYLALSLLMRLGLWVFGQIVFTRQRKLGNAK